jgi:hypothetical protein
MPLDRLDDGIWTVTAPLMAMGVIPMTSRMTVIRLPGDGGLLVHSPVKISPDIHRELTALGPVRHVVAPNRMHHMFCGDFRAAYPEARLYGAPGVAKKRPDLPLDGGELGDTAPEAWAGEVDQALVGGIPMLNEVVFLHRPSGTLIATDTAANVAPSDPMPVRVWARLNRVYGRLATPLEVRLVCRDRQAARRGLEKVLAWDFDRVIVGHGAVVPTGGKARAREAFAWA